MSSEMHPLLVEYYSNSSIENWVACRREWLSPDIPRIAGSEWLPYVEEIFGEYGITEENFAKILIGDLHVIQSVSMAVVFEIDRTNKLQKEGETQLSRRGIVATSEFINWITCVMIDSIWRNKILDVPLDLQMLVRIRLVPNDPAIERRRAVLKSMEDAIAVGAFLLWKRQKPTFREVAKILGVQPSTIKRWFDSPEQFQELARQEAEACEREGLFETT